MSNVTIICACILLSALAVILRIHKFEEALARTAYAACNSKDTSLLKLVSTDSFVP